MYKNSTKHKHSRNDDYDLYQDLLNIRDAFTDTARDVKGKTGSLINQSLEAMKERTTNLQDEMVSYTRAKPVKTLGFAVLVGLVLGLLIHRK